MKELSAIVLEMDRHGKRLSELLKASRLNEMSRDEFHEMGSIMERLIVLCADFNALHFGSAEERTKRARSGG